MNTSIQKFIVFVLMLMVTGGVYAKKDKLHAEGTRKIISLDGTWQIAEGGMFNIPAKFDRTIIVPGLLDMAKPAFTEPGPKVADRGAFLQKDPRRDAFWYRRTFKISGPIPEFGELKIGKAMYGTRVYLNGLLIGDHIPCFTPGWFDVRNTLKIGENELIVRIGADRDAVSSLVESGQDGEKSRYIPGIYDHVELVMAGSPHITNVQAVPDIVNHSVTVHTWIKCTPNPVATKLHITIREAVSKKVAGVADCLVPAIASGSEQTGSLTIPLKGCRLWSPEDPFLYELEVRSEADNFNTRFGMRSFRLDPATGRAILNGKPYFMRGSNVTMLRFLEDSLRGNKPWSEDWVRRLHKKFRDMHWNSLRYCIGFAPELWYRIADEEGLLIQDEYPVWHGSTKIPASLKAEVLAVEFREWMKERWNHPCVVIWDACNETYSPETGKAIREVRGLDFSNRPWDNGWGEPVNESDPDECHPYHFIFGPNQPFRMADLAKDLGTKAGLLIAQPYEKEKLFRKNPLIINEYGGLWINRDGTPTTLSKPLYDYLMDPLATKAERMQLYARNTAAITEFFRAHRQAAAVMYFCGLGYSRPDGQTSDDWSDIEKLTWNPEFYTYVRDAFAPVGLMLDVWADEFPAGKTLEFPVIIFNDLGNPWKGDILFRLSQDGKIISEKTVQTEVTGHGTTKLFFPATIPDKASKYQAEAILINTPTGNVHSLRDFAVLTSAQREACRNLALGKPVKASSDLVRGSTSCRAEFAVDGDRSSCWASAKGKQKWLAVDLGKMKTISHIEIACDWSSLATPYSIQVSKDGQDWKDVYASDQGMSYLRTETVRFAAIQTRWVRIAFPGHENEEGPSIYELAVFH
jgi:hypothetical protein